VVKVNAVLMLTNVQADHAKACKMELWQLVALVQIQQTMSIFQSGAIAVHVAQAGRVQTAKLTTTSVDQAHASTMLSAANRPAITQCHSMRFVANVLRGGQTGSARRRWTKQPTQIWLIGSGQKRDNAMRAL
jgi:hypothetical protein